MGLIKVVDTSVDAQLKKHLNASLDRMERTGTSRDESEWVTFHDEHVYRGYTCLIARIPVKKKMPLLYDISTHSGSTYAWQGCAKETIATNGHVNELKTPKVKDLTTAGKILHKYIDMLKDNGKN
jgi:hypothetical protein